MAVSEFGGQIPFFLENILARPASALPKGAQWVLAFEGNFSGAKVIPDKAIKAGIRYEPRKWDIDKAIDETLISDYQSTKGCMFAQAVQLPGESVVANPEGLQQNGFLRTYVGGGRDPYAAMQIVFLDTNVSFVDNVIRPWVIATGHLGLIARSGDKDYRCNISVYKLGVTESGFPNKNNYPYVAQKYTFYGACPVSVSGEEYNYTQTSTPVNRETTFIYHYYTIETGQTNKALSNNTANQPLPLSTKTAGDNVYVARATKA